MNRIAAAALLFLRFSVIMSWCGEGAMAATVTTTDDDANSNANSNSGPWAPRPDDRPAEELPTIGVIGGTGRMGVHLCAA